MVGLLDGWLVGRSVGRLDGWPLWLLECLFVCLLRCLFLYVYVFVCPIVCLSVYLLVCLIAFCLFVSFCLSFCLCFFCVFITAISRVFQESFKVFSGRSKIILTIQPNSSCILLAARRGSLETKGVVGVAGFSVYTSVFEGRPGAGLVLGSRGGALELKR